MAPRSLVRILSMAALVSMCAGCTGTRPDAPSVLPQRAAASFDGQYRNASPYPFDPTLWSALGGEPGADKLDDVIELRVKGSIVEVRVHRTGALRRLPCELRKGGLLVAKGWAVEGGPPWRTMGLTKTSLWLQADHSLVVSAGIRGAFLLGWLPADVAYVGRISHAYPRLSP